MRKLLAPLAIVGLLVSCGGDDSDVTPSTEAASTEETTTEAPVEETTTEAPAEEATDIVAIASGNEDFSTLVAAVAAAGLVETLQGEGPFTVFAPTNAAFEALAAEVMIVKSPGPCTLDPADLDWRRLRPGVRLGPLGPVRHPD
mgnify:CR=1 FL=1